MHGFRIANLISEEESFVVPSLRGTWEFYRRSNYRQMVKSIEEGAYAVTYTARNDGIGEVPTDDELSILFGEIVDICLLLSFITAKCVTPVDTVGPLTLLSMPDSFPRPRGIVGFNALDFQSTFTDIFKDGMEVLQERIRERRLRLMLSHWISGLTCFALEDIFLFACVQMDIVKQCEIKRLGDRLEYFEGMCTASNYYRISSLNKDYTKMRNDLVHEGRLSGPKFRNKSKEDCASVVCDTLNWIDRYVAAALNIGSHFGDVPRWTTLDVLHGLPSISLWTD
jgi:hypothetical protein